MNNQFTQLEEKARRHWRSLQDKRRTIEAAMGMCANGYTRKELHKLLDHRLDAIEAGEARAIANFPGVKDSFTIATYTMRMP